MEKIMNKLEGMPCPNIINLRECEDRREYTRKEFEKLGITNIKFHVYERYENSNVKYVGDPKLIAETTRGVTSSHFLTIKRWFENTNEEMGIFFEDDVDFSLVEYWNFTFKQFVERCGNKWGVLHLGTVFEYPFDSLNEYPPMIPRKRMLWDHGLQCYLMKREYAQKFIRFYFDQGDDTIHYRMPHGTPVSTENNILHGFGNVYTFPLFNHNVNDFKSKNIYNYNDQAKSAIYSYEYLKDWWSRLGSKYTLEDIFDKERVKQHTYGEIEL
jgi:GR25 family glycosyltransferase involved in LPS biosynthesis